MLNKAILMGRLTADPDVRNTPNGVSVTTFSLAVDRSYTKQGEERQTDFINIVCWRGTADFAGKYLKKGQLVAVEGAIRTRNYTDNNGDKRYVTEVVANEVFFAEKRSQTAEVRKDASVDVQVQNEADFVRGEQLEYSDGDLPF